MTSPGAKAILASTITALTKQHPGLELDITARTHDIHIHKIVVPADQRRAGIGTAVMNELANVADQHGWTLTVTPSADLGTPTQHLNRFYTRLGYQPNSGRNKDYSISAALIRTPAQPQTPNSAASRPLTRPARPWHDTRTPITPECDALTL